MARRLNVTVVIFNNRSYSILNVELARVRAQGAGPKANAQLDLSGPDLDFVQIASGLGVPAKRVDTAEQLAEVLPAAVAEPGPHLVEVVIAPTFSRRQCSLPCTLRPGVLPGAVDLASAVQRLNLRSRPSARAGGQACGRAGGGDDDGRDGGADGGSGGAGRPCGSSVVPPDDPAGWRPAEPRGRADALPQTVAELVPVTAGPAAGVPVTVAVLVNVAGSLFR